MAGKNFPHIVGNLFMLITFLSAFTCLARSDYNFAFALFFYYLWTVKRDADTAQILLIGTVVLVVFDAIWLSTVGGVWTEVVPENPTWNSFRGMHIFIIGLSVINLIIKLGVIGLLFLIRREPDEASVSMIMMMQQGQTNQYY